MTLTPYTSTQEIPLGIWLRRTQFYLNAIGHGKETPDQWAWVQIDGWYRDGVSVDGVFQDFETLLRYWEWTVDPRAKQPVVNPCGNRN